MLRWLEWLVLGAAALYTLVGVDFIRSSVRKGSSVTYGTIFSQLWGLVSLVVVVLAGYSRFHLLWLYPVGYVAGFFAMFFPFNLVGIPLAKLYGSICTIGLNQEEVARNTARQRYAEWRVRERSSQQSYEQAKTAVVDEVRAAYDYIPRRMLELTRSGTSDREATSIVSEEIAELQGDSQGKALLAAENLPPPVAPRGRWIKQFLLTLGYGILVVLWNTAGAFAVGFFVGLAGYELQEWAFQWIGWLFMIPAFAWLMPKIGRPWWHSFGMVIPILNIFLGWAAIRQGP
jgi:hypothetical protein